MKMLRAWMSLVLVCSTGLIVGAAAAQDGYPSKPIRLVVPYTPAGGTDLLARMVARRLGESLGVTVVIDNRPGADGTIGTNVVAKANPDGYTLLLDGTSQAYNVAFGKQMPYDPARDLMPIVQTGNQQVLLMVNNTLPVKNVKELIAYAKKHPGQLNYGSSSNANALPMELFKVMTDTKMVHVPYRGSGPMLTDLLGGQVQLAMSGAAAPLPHIKAGKLRALGIGDRRRSPSLPNFPTIAQSGVSGFETLQWSGMFAPAGTQTSIIDRLNREVVAILQDPEFKKEMIEAGFDPVEGPNTPQTWRQVIADDVTKWSAIVKQVGLQAK